MLTFSQGKPMSNLLLFSFQDRHVRTTITKCGQPAFAAKDVADVFNIRDYKQLIDQIKEFFYVQRGGSIIPPPLDVLHLIDTETDRGKQATTFITEPAVYFIVFRSRKPIAKEFQQWVFTEVLPQIRNKGSYNSAPEPLVLGQDKELLKLQLDCVSLLKEINGPDIVEKQPRIAQLINDFAVRQIGSGNGVAPALPTERFAGVVERAEALGYNPYTISKHSSQLGKYVATRYRLEFELDPETEERIHNGRMTKMKVYNSSQWYFIDGCIRSFFAHNCQIPGYMSE